MMGPGGAGDAERAAAEAEAQLREAMEAGEVLQGQLQDLEQQLGFINAMIQELQRGRATLEALRAAKPGDEVLLPVGGGAYVQATLARADRVLVPIGSGLQVEGAVDDAVRRLDEQLERTREAGKRLQEEAVRVTEQLQAVEAHVAQFAR